MHTASRRTTFATAALTAALALWTSGAPSVVYPVYGRFVGDPLHASYWPLLGAIPVTLALALRLPAGTRVAGRRAQLLRVHRSTSGVVVQGALAVAAAYGGGGVVLALGADVAVGL